MILALVTPFSARASSSGQARPTTRASVRMLRIALPKAELRTAAVAPMTPMTPLALMAQASCAQGNRVETRGTDSFLTLCSGSTVLTVPQADTSSFDILLLQEAAGRASRFR